jgi:tetratricopeptide (TPR) repeat protein
MNRKNHPAIPVLLARCCGILLLCAGLFYTACASAQIDVMDSIDITPAADQTEIRINLNVPVRYKSHSPKESGDVLRINVEPVPTLGAEGDVLFTTQSIQWSASDTVPLNEVVYNSSGFATSTITLQFARVTRYEIPPSPDPRVLVIIVRHLSPTGVTPLPSPGDEYPYVINLASSTEPFATNELPKLDILLAYRVYTARFDKDGKTWNRLRVGFFGSRQEAETVLRELQPYFPGAWITQVSAQERESSADEVLPAPEQITEKPVRVAPPSGSVSANEADRIAGMMEQANAMMTDKDYDGAIRLYTKIIEYPEHASSREALEFLGLARERKGQSAQAKAVYDDYLAQYPEGEDAERVRQRLDALITASGTPREKLSAVKAKGETASAWDMFGGFSQFYRRDENTTQVDDQNELTTLTQSSLSSDLDVTGRLLKGSNDLRTRLTGGYLHDFLNQGEDNETSISSLYFDAQNRQRRLGARLGRQSRSTGGVLGRFDGLLLELPLTRVIHVALTGGSPVDSAQDDFDESRYFYGGSLELEGFANGWDANTFFIEQQVDGIIDRRAVGGEMRYFDPQRSFFTLVDYDVLYNDLNTVQLLGNWTAADRTTVNLLLDYRNSPILTTSNALQGQTALTIEELLATYSEQEIFDLAMDRTASNKLATLGIARPITRLLQINGDITISRLSDTPASGGVAAVPGTDNEFFYNLQLIGSDLFKPGDLTVLGARYSDATTADTTSILLNTRYPVTNDFRVNPQMRIDYRRNQVDDTDQYIYRPSARLTWNVKRSFRLEAELGGEWSDRELVSGSAESNSYFINLGYRADF